MPRFFLHIDNGVQRIEDEEGGELPDNAAARDEALIAARHLWAAAIVDCRDLGEHSFLIADEEGDVIDTVSMDDALPKSLIDRLRLNGCSCKHLR